MNKGSLKYRDRLDGLNTEKQAKLEILSQNRKDLQTQVARIKQTLEKVLDQNTSLAERIRTLFREQGITYFYICYCGQCYWCNFKLPWEGRWICC